MATEHGSDICECGDFRSQHRTGKCSCCGCNRFRFAWPADANNRAIWEKYHKERA